MAPVLYFVTYSQPSRAALLTIKALNIDVELKEISLINREQFSPEYLKINPQHTVPTLVEEDGFVIWDSHVIMEYLVDKYAKDDKLYPKDLRKRALVNQRLHFESGVLFPTHMAIVRPILYGGATIIPEDKIESVKDTYKLLEQFLNGHNWVAGENMTIADFSILSSITVMNILVPIEAQEFPNIVNWLKRMETLPYYEVSQKGVNQIEKLIQEKLNQAKL